MQKLGKLIILEGPDGVGKTTLSLALTDYFQSQGIKCKYMSFPGREIGTLGYLVYDLHHNLEKYKIQHLAPISLQLLHIAAHIDSIESEIRPILMNGEYLILDRYWWSTWVYGQIFGINLNVLEIMINLEKKSWGNILPSCSILLDRNESLRKEYTTIEWNNLRNTYVKIATNQKSLYPVHIIKNETAVEETMIKIISVLNLENEFKQVKSLNSTKKVDPKNDIQLELKIDNQSVKQNKVLPLTIINKLSPVVPSEVYATYWMFAAERQEIFFRKLHGHLYPWTEDPILTKYKFTNAYRASDRVSQYLIKNVIYIGDQSVNELFFRIMLFKIFNKIETWKLLNRELGEIEYKNYSFERYDEIITKAFLDGTTIFSSAYIMPSGGSTFGFARKHRNYLMLLEKMINDHLPLQIAKAKSMKDVFELIRSYPLMGDFLAYQYTIDLNYSILTNFSEMEFVVPGPGARDGIRKCFSNMGGLNEADIIRLVAERQDEDFSLLGINFKSLFARPLQLIDCQNLFCEVDKYARVAHPDVIGISARKRIKQTYRSIPEQVEYWYPPKWGINGNL